MIAGIGYDNIFKALVIIILIIISIVDFKKFEIPDSLSFLLIILGLAYNYFFKDRGSEALIGMGVYSLPFSLIYGYVSELYKKEVLGFGDVKLAMGLGAVLTFSNFEKVYMFFMVSFVVASLYCIFLLIKIRKRQIEFPFGPFISISGGIMLIMGGV